MKENELTVQDVLGLNPEFESKLKIVESILEILKGKTHMEAKGILDQTIFELFRRSVVQ